MTVLIDSDILIEVSRGRNRAVVSTMDRIEHLRRRRSVLTR